jgi:uncharacterized protein YoaH (UPF0181 family)
MNIGIIHFTDLHFEEKDNIISERITNIYSALNTNLNDVEKIYIVISGDIVNRGQIKGYIEAENFINKVKSLINEVVETKVIITPGNHDLNFAYNTQIRDFATSNISYESIGNKDDSVIDICLSTQKDFWEFYGKFNELPDNKLFYQISDSVSDTIINFNCINSSWASKQKEENNLFFPIKRFDTEEYLKKGSLNISVIHHPLAWFRPSGAINHRKEIQAFIEDNSSINLFGHEHIEHHNKTTELGKNKDCIHISGRLLQDSKNHNDSGFQTIILNSKNKKGKIYNYLWEDDIFKLETEKTFQINGEDYGHKRFKHNIEYINEINRVKIPLAIDNNPDVTLSDFYVYPDFEKINQGHEDENYYDSINLGKEESFNSCIIEGDNQSGKTSLISMLYLSFVDEDKYPVYVDCKSFSNQNIDKVINKSFTKQYKTENIDIQRFNQYDKSKKIILIDNLHQLNYNAKTISKIIKDLEAKFCKIIILTNTSYGLISKIESEIENLTVFKIKPLGYKKRNQLIENYHKLSLCHKTGTDEILLNQTKNSFNQVELVLGNKLMPSYPAFILSILQTLVYNKPSNLEQTSYGYCYHSLIHIALAKNGNVVNEYIDTFFNFLSEFSLNLFEYENTTFTEKEFENYFNDYKNKFHVAFSFETFKKSILDSKLIIIEEDTMKFSYIYVYYFLVARKISEIITKDSGKKIIQKLCKNIDKQQNANILVFVSHHTKDDYLIEEATFTSMIPFENLKPITLDVHGEYYDMLKDIVKEISSDVIESSSNPIKSREKILENQDKLEVKNSRHKREIQNQEKDETIQELMSPISKSFQAIEVVGQIIRNRKGSIPTEDLINMIEELYKTAFRTISFFGESLRKGRKDFTETFLNQYKEEDSKNDVKEKVNSFFQYLSLKICLDVFGKIIYSVGEKDLKELYIAAANKIDSPAAHIVTFSINSYYGNMSKNDLRNIVKKYEKNPVAMEIIKKRVRSYLYQNYVDYKKRQSFASTLHMKILPPQKK